MTIYRMMANVKRNRFMERPLYFTEQMCVIADSYDQACAYVRERFAGANDEVKVIYEGEEDLMALFDIRDGEKVIV